MPAFGAEPLPENAAAQNHLQETLASLAIPPVAGAEVSPLAGEVSGRRYVMGENQRGIVAFSFDFGEKQNICTIELNGSFGPTEFPRLTGRAA